MPKGPLVFQSDVIWFPSEIRRLLRAIEKYPGLFDPRNEAFGIREKSNIMWGAVARLVGGTKTDVQCRDKWTCLRGTYRRHVRTELTNSVRRRSNWPWVEDMNFMRNYILDKEEMAEAQLLSKKVKPSTRSKSSDSSEAESKSTEPPAVVKKHQPNCPQSQTGTAVMVTTSSSSVPHTTANLPFTGNIYSGGIIYSGVGLGLVQPTMVTKGVRCMTLSQPNLRMIQPKPANMSLSLLRTTQPLRLVQASQGSNGVAVVQPPKAMATVTCDPIQVDLGKVKPDPDTLDNTEFIDMNTVIKKEPIDTDGDEQINEFLPEDPSDMSGIANIDENEQSHDGSHRSDQSSPKLNERASPKPAEDNIKDSNQLFMSSVLANMRKLTPYDQSVFRLKVLQILHEMMFPKK